MKIPVFIQKVKHAAGRMRSGTLNQYACELPERPRGLFLPIFKKLFCRIELSGLNTQAIHDLSKDGAVVYVNKFKSKFEFLYAHTCYFSRSIPAPAIGLGHRFIIYQPVKKLLQMAALRLYRLFTLKKVPDILQSSRMEDQLFKGKPVFISLVESRDFYLRFLQKKDDPLGYLIALQQKSQRPIIIVPQLFFYSKTPDTAKLKFKDILFGPDQRPGKARKIFNALFSPEKMFVELSQPVNLKTFLSKHGNVSSDTGLLAMMLRRDLLNQITRHRQSTTGPVLKSHEEIKQSILTDEDLLTYLHRYAARRNISLGVARREAVSYFDEIAAKYRPAIVSIAVRIVHWLSTTFFEGINVDIKRFKNIKTMALQGPVIFVPCHRSHIDSLVMMATTYTNHLSPPHIFAGKNLSFWPMGPLLRMIGVFFVRRSFQGAVFYTKVFSAYVSKLIEEGYHLNVFIEGTRSRSGKLLQPQLGMLTILMDVFQKHPEKDLIFVPVYIGYDQVPEEKEYLNEIQGGKKKPEDARQLVKFGKLFKKRFGKIYVKFTEPLSLKDFLSQLEISSGKLTSKEKNTVSKRLGECLMSHIDQATVVTPQALVAGALLNGDRPLRTFENLWKQIESYMAYLNYKKADLSESLIIDPKNAVEHILNQFVGAKIIDTVQAKPNQWSAADTLKLNKNKRAAADYYKNNCIIHFVPVAFTAISILVRDAFQFQTMDVVPTHEFLTDLFQFEFTHDPDKNPDHYVRKSIKAFIDDAILIPHPTLPDTYAITSPGFRKLKDFAAFVIPFVEAYWIVLQWLSQEPKKNVDAKARLRKLLNFGEHLLKKRSISRSEALSNLNIENAVFYFNRSGLRGMEDKNLINYYHDQLAPIMEWIEV